MLITSTTERLRRHLYLANVNERLLQTGGESVGCREKFVFNIPFLKIVRTYCISMYSLNLICPMLPTLYQLSYNHDKKFDRFLMSWKCKNDCLCYFVD
jgi:hypothetical protein